LPIGDLKTRNQQLEINRKWAIGNWK